jgi:hypothetical protein
MKKTISFIASESEKVVPVWETRWKARGNDYATIVVGANGEPLQPICKDKKGSLGFLAAEGDFMVRVRRKPGNKIKVEFLVIVKIHKSHDPNSIELYLGNKYKEGVWAFPPSPVTVPMMKAALKKLDTDEPCFALVEGLESVRVTV